ncbi:flagellar assembly protein FliH [Bosea caraganae]|uniref:Flagellar assembly protein FliH n=2 Tax=Bosea caraganae TaxID=2763117 RepID=A0A370L6X2_9HYPH|nr:FliH/SctL family protein [Bosea caraganae]RDJ25383.1 flagellar assembly protein FliH [Bosea caraganae]RDJ25832.1 flagellar assembly protein FliH [Bosea caraganae]
MGTAKKFMFGTDFREGGRRATTEADIASARAEGFSAGQEQGRREAESQFNALVGKLVRSADKLVADEQKRLAEIEGQAAQVAIVTAQGLARAALAQQPLAALERAVRECLGHARLAPHLVVRVNETAVEPVESMLAGLAREMGFAGRLVVLGQPDIAIGDGRIEWADGGFVVDGARLEQLVEQAVASLFGPHQLGGTERRSS